MLRSKLAGWEIEMINGVGMRRMHGLGGRPDLAFVVDKSISFEITERLYRDRGYSPPFDQLPWEKADRNP
jgi:hypothetical protein